MKRVFAIFILSCFIMIFSVGCGDNSSKTEIIDCDTHEIITHFSDNDYNEAVLKLTNATNYPEDADVGKDTAPKYEVHFIDPKDSALDIWYFIYIVNDEVYFKFDTEKIQMDFDFGNEIKKSTTLTVDELNEILLIGK